MTRLIFLLLIFVISSQCYVTEKRLEAFNDWLTSNGATYPSVYIGESAHGGFGIIAKEKIKNEVFMNIPAELFVGPHSWKRTSIPEILKLEELKNGPTLLALFLAIEYRNPMSFWKPYFDVLPKRLDLPLMWDADELEELQGTWLYDRTLFEIASISHGNMGFEYLFKLLNGKFPKIFNEKSFTLPKWKWAWAIIWSRAFVGNGVKLLVPLADFLNHKPRAQAEFKFENKAWKFTTKDTYHKGDEIYYDYQVPSNNLLLRNFGFIMPDSDLSVPFPIVPSGLPEGLSEELERHNLTLSYPFAEYIYYLDKHGWSKEVTKYFSVVHPEFHETPEIPVKNLIIHTLKQFKTSIEEDEQILKKTDITPRKRLAVEIRLENKKLLMKFAR